jgi:hypothetical protein
MGVADAAGDGVARGVSRRVEGRGAQLAELVHLGEKIAVGQARLFPAAVRTADNGTGVDAGDEKGGTAIQAVLQPPEQGSRPIDIELGRGAIAMPRAPPRQGGGENGHKQKYKKEMPDHTVHNIGILPLLAIRICKQAESDQRYRIKKQEETGRSGRPARPIPLF